VTENKNKGVEYNVDVDRLAKGDKQLVRELTDIFDKNPNTNLKLLAETLRVKYGIDEAEIMPIEGSIYEQFSKPFKLSDQIAGFMQDYSSGKRVRIPYINLSGDLKTLNSFVQHIYDAGYQMGKVDSEKKE